MCENDGKVSAINASTNKNTRERSKNSLISAECAQLGLVRKGQLRIEPRRLSYDFDKIS